MEKEAAVNSENFLFKKTDLLPTFSQFPKISSVTTDELPTIRSKKEDLINAEKGVMSTTITVTMKLSKETHLEEEKTPMKEDKSVEEVSLTEDKEKVRIYYLLLPLFLLLVAFMCLLCILTVLVC